MYRVSLESFYSPASDSSYIRGILSDYIYVRWFEHQRILLVAVVFQNIIKFVISFQPQLIFAVLSRNRISVVLRSESHFRGPLSKVYFRGPLFRMSFSQSPLRILFSRSSF